jgi:hypothetical protein
MDKPAKEWTETDLQKLIADEVKESPELDYKRCDALQKTDGKKNEISKDVSAFANSAGGTLIYGVIEENHLPVDLDDGFDPQDISREWLEDVINSRIHPRIDGIEIGQVPLRSHAPGKVAYVVRVPASGTAHMASDHKYYRRYNFQNRPMEDYEVRERMFKVTHPKLLCYGVRIDPAGSRTGKEHYADAVLQIENVGSVFAEHYAVELRLPSRFRYHASPVKPARLSRTDDSDMYLLHGPGGVFPGQVQDMPPVRLRMTGPDLDLLERAVADMTIYAGNAPPKEVRKRLADDPKMKKIIEKMRRW